MMPDKVPSNARLVLCEVNKDSSSALLCITMSKNVTNLNGCLYHVSHHINDIIEHQFYKLYVTNLKFCLL